MTILRRLALGAAGGSAGALLALAVGVIGLVLSLLTGHRVSLDSLWPALGWYVGGFIAAGLLGGLAWPLARKRAGRFATAIAGAAVVVGAASVAVEGAPWTWSGAAILTWVGLSIVLGIAAGFGLRDETEGLH